jgi:hypothetical protein
MPQCLKTNQAMDHRLLADSIFPAFRVALLSYMTQIRRLNVTNTISVGIRFRNSWPCLLSPTLNGHCSLCENAYSEDYVGPLE